MPARCVTWLINSSIARNPPSGRRGCPAARVATGRMPADPLAAVFGPPWLSRSLHALHAQQHLQYTGALGVVEGGETVIEGIAGGNKVRDLHALVAECAEG